MIRPEYINLYIIKILNYAGTGGKLRIQINKNFNNTYSNVAQLVAMIQICLNGKLLNSNTCVTTTELV